MDLSRQLLNIFLMFLLSFFYIRGFIFGLILYRIRSRTHAKKAKGQTLKEWFFYSRFKELIPSFFLIIYFAVIILHLLGASMCVIFDLLNLSTKLGDPTAKIIYYFDGIWILVLWLFFWSPKEVLKYERWISKDWKKKKE